MSEGRIHVHVSFRCKTRRDYSLRSGAQRPGRERQRYLAAGRVSGRLNRHSSLADVDGELLGARSTRTDSGSGEEPAIREERAKGKGRRAKGEGRRAK